MSKLTVAGEACLISPFLASFVMNGASFFNDCLGH